MSSFFLKVLLLPERISTQSGLFKQLIYVPFGNLWPGNVVSQLAVKIFLGDEVFYSLQHPDILS